MSERKETMLRAAYAAEGARHSRWVIFWLGGGWKWPAGVLALVAVGFGLVEAGRWVGHHVGSVGPAVAVALALVLVAVVGRSLARAGRRGGRRFR